ncbi:MAG TPA: deoxyguanosinetriphosphate triphosphohydrolase [Candidatus Binatia bacterium]|nr:deoxyguanosinetriphosphate triphosphohydrolase [Candidatus Binatia bacterium]
MLAREEFEALEDRLLAPYAMRNRRTRGRVHAEAEHPFRMPFQRDRDRIIHCSAFRRLEYKTQVFVNHEGDYYRTRLTHTMEAAQITRTIARALRLNEDLAEAVALAHDLGHTPFGHAGERILNRLMEPHGGFEHNAQSMRIVDVLEERYPDFPGLNLSWEVREGIVKHSTRYDRPQVAAFDADKAPTLEAQIVDYADEIAYNAHDIDDGLKSGMLRLDDLEAATIWRDHHQAVRQAFPRAEFRIVRYQTTRRIIDTFVGDLIESTEKNLRRQHVERIEDVWAVKPKLVEFSAEVAEQVRELKALLYERLYNHYRVKRMAVKADRIMSDLFQTYMSEPRQMPPHVYRKIVEGEPTAGVVADYIAGMTDRFALDEYKKLFDPYEKV